MAYTVKQVARMSGVSVRTLHFYDESGLLKPAFVGTNGYRFYQEEQLLALQQILFFRELGFDLARIKGILCDADFERAGALRSQRELLKRNLARMQALIQTLDKTVSHLEGATSMSGEDLFEGFRLAAGEDRFGDRNKLAGEPNDCKLSGRDTGGAVCIFEFTGSTGGPRHLHYDQDEWVYVIDGEFEVAVGDRRLPLSSGECVLLPRKVAHVWASVSDRPGKILNLYQPAGNIEEFFLQVGRYNGGPPIHEALQPAEFHRLFQDHGMDLVGPPLSGTWEIDADNRIKQTS